MTREKLNANQNQHKDTSNTVQLICVTESGQPSLATSLPQNACEQLKERLEPFRKAAPDGTFSDWVLAAYQSRVNLSVCGFEA